MELNSLLFPAPNTKYTAEELEGEIMYVPRYYKFNANHRKLMKVIDSEIEAQKIGNSHGIKHRVVEKITISNIVNHGGIQKGSEEQIKFNKPRFTNDSEMQKDIMEFYER